MNRNNLAHSNIQNQQPSSWKDDPFDLKGKFTGVKRLNHKQQLSYYAQELVADYGKYNYDLCELNLMDLSTENQNELVRLYIETTGRELTECVNGNDFSINNNFTSALLLMLHNDCQETREHFADVTRRNVLTYYKESLQDVLDEACHDYWCALNAEQGFYSQQDSDTGEIVWGKF